MLKLAVISTFSYLCYEPFPTTPTTLHYSALLRSSHFPTLLSIISTPSLTFPIVPSDVQWLGKPLGFKGKGQEGKGKGKDFMTLNKPLPL